MKKRFFLTSLFLILVLTLSAQDSATRPATCYRLHLTDKNQSPYSISRPEEFLSQRAIDHKNRYFIPITEEDLPINPQYKQQICAINSDIRILTESKWQNTVVIYCPDSLVLTIVKALPFVDTNVIAVANFTFQNEEPQKNESMNLNESILANHLSDSSYNYGPSFGQIALHNGHLMHQLGFKGDSMLVAVLDGGWEGFDTISYFRDLYNNGQIWGTMDLVPQGDSLLPRNNNVYIGSGHGTGVVSTMASVINGQLIGTAPHANYFFIRTENPYSEELIEEDFWARGAEIADSLGADVLSSSLGYSLFPDFPEGDNTYTKCDGVTSIASRNATLACHKGAVVCVSAGNEGQKPWHYITAPADAFDIITVGAANADSVIAPFSSFGPTYDGRVKPDAVAVGWQSYVVGSNGTVRQGNGTSYACPILAGMVTCLRQSLPQMGALDIVRIVRQAGHQYNNPDTAMGYGIPDIYKAYLENREVVSVNDFCQEPLSIYPNPCSNNLLITNLDYSIEEIQVFDVSGKLVLTHTNCYNTMIQIATDRLSSGLYILKTKEKNKIRTAKFIKQ
ncbi:MAG: S8 family peptidase [Bacteroidales bacterium]|nr:S8 family peptidase [Bacteroidales bacterium]